MFTLLSLTFLGQEYMEILNTPLSKSLVTYRWSLLLLAKDSAERFLQNHLSDCYETLHTVQTIICANVW